MGKEKKIEEEKLYRMSYYYEEFKKPMFCPYCGSKMIFDYYVFYEGCTREWICTTCGLRIEDSAYITKEELRRKRRAWRRYLKKELEELRRKLARVEKAYSSYGKYMSPEEKREILGELLEETNEGTATED